MSTPSNARPSGRDKLAEMRAAEARSGQQKKLLGLVAAFVAVVLAVVGVMAVISSNTSGGGSTPDAAAISKMQKVSDSTFDKVGVGTAQNFPVKLSGATAQTKDGKPQVTYFGAEYCPYCAMERWAMVAALSRFGTWSGLSGTKSADTDGDIPTVTFLKAHYTSPYLALTTYETEDRDKNPLQTPPAADEALINKYDTPTYIPGMQANQAGAIPFTMYGGTYATSGSTYLAFDQMQNGNGNKIADKLNDTDNTTTKGIIGAANVISAQICSQNGNKPANVCNSAGVKAAAAKLNK